MPQTQFIKPNKMPKKTNQHQWPLISWIGWIGWIGLISWIGLIGLLSIPNTLQAQISTPAISIDSTYNTNSNQTSYLQEYRQLIAQRKEVLSKLTQAQTELLISQEKIDKHTKRYRRTLGWSIPVGFAASSVIFIMLFGTGIGPRG